MEIENIIARVTEEVSKRLTDTDTEKRDAEKCTSSLAGVIEHSLLNPDTAAEVIRLGCEDAKKYGFANVCVSPYYVSMAAELLHGSGVGICTPVGFPHAAASTKAKCTEIREAIMNGATELDVSIMITAVKSGDFDGALKDIAEMVSVADGRAKVKAIYEQGLYTDEEKVKVLNIAVQCGADFIKISNALTGKKACIEDVKFVRSLIGDKMGIKIDGGIKDAVTASALLDAGANRLGCSASVQIVTGRIK